MNAQICAFTVYGTPRPQGSTVARTFRDAHGHAKTAITHSNRASLLQWRQDIRAAVQQHVPALQGALVDGPVAIVAKFHTVRPPSVSVKRRFPAVAPDLDKLLRAVGDALEATVLRSDAQIVGWLAWKVYTDGPARLELTIWQPDAPVLPAPDDNPFAQPVLF